MRPAEAPDGPPHRRFAELLAILSCPPSTVLQHGGIGGRLQPRAQRRLPLGTNPAWTARNGLAFQRAGLARLHHGTFHRGDGDIKAASGFSHGLTRSHRSHQAFFQVDRIGTHTWGLCTTHACLCFSQVALGQRRGSPRPQCPPDGSAGRPGAQRLVFRFGPPWPRLLCRLA